MMKKRQEEIKEAGRRGRKEGEREKKERGRGRREVGERTRKERRRRKEEKLLAVFVSGRRIGMCGGGWLSSFWPEYRNVSRRISSIPGG